MMFWDKSIFLLHLETESKHISSSLIAVSYLNVTVNSEVSVV